MASYGMQTTNAPFSRLQLVNPFILQLWVGCGRHGELVTFDAETLRKKHSIFVETRGISKITQIQDKVL